MPDIHVRRLEKPTAEELDAAASVLAKATAEDPFVISAVGGDKELMIPFQRATIAAAAVGGGELYVASYGEQEDIVGAAAWFGPGTAILHTPEQGEAGFNALLGGFKPELMKWWTEYFLQKYEAQTTSTLGEGVKFGAWHLQMLGVLPEFQRKGIARALLSVIDEKAAVDGKLRCLETENPINLPIYERLGYTVRGKEDYESSQGGFSVWVLTKE